MGSPEVRTGFVTPILGYASVRFCPIPSKSACLGSQGDLEMSYSTRESDETQQPKHQVRATHSRSVLGRALYTSSPVGPAGQSLGSAESVPSKRVNGRRKSGANISAPRSQTASKSSVSSSSSSERPSLKIGHAQVCALAETVPSIDNDEEAEGEMRFADLPPSSPGLEELPRSPSPFSQPANAPDAQEAADISPVVDRTSAHDRTSTLDLSQTFDDDIPKPPGFGSSLALSSDVQYSQNLFTQNSAPSNGPAHTTTSPVSFKATQLAKADSDDDGDIGSRASLKGATPVHNAVSSPSKSNRSSARAGQSTSERRKLRPTIPSSSPNPRKPVRIEETPCSNPETFIDLPPTVEEPHVDIQPDIIPDGSSPPFKSAEILAAKVPTDFEPTMLNDQSLPELVPKPTPIRTYGKAPRSTPRRSQRSREGETTARPTSRTHGSTRMSSHSPSPAQRDIADLPGLVVTSDIDSEADQELTGEESAPHREPSHTPSGSLDRAPRKTRKPLLKAEEEHELDELDHLLSSSESPIPDPMDETYVARATKTKKRKAPSQVGRGKSGPPKPTGPEQAASPQARDAPDEPHSESDDESQSSGSTPRDPTDETFRPSKKPKSVTGAKRRTGSKRGARETRSKPKTPVKMPKGVSSALEGVRDEADSLEASQDLSSRTGGRVPADLAGAVASSDDAPLRGKVFLLSTKFVGSDGEKKALMKKRGDSIRKLGGRVEEKWEELFDLSTGFESTFDSQLEDAPFLLLLGRDLVTTPKFLICVAKGIPCLDESYLNDIIEGQSVDWRSYLVPTGRPLARLHRHHSTCQLVDHRWATAEWSSATAVAPRRPFLGKSFAFVNSRNKRYADLDVLVPACLHALGAASFSATLVVPDTLDECDFLLVENRDEKLKIPASILATGKVGNTAWLKQCILAGAALPPTLFKD